MDQVHVSQLSSLVRGARRFIEYHKPAIEKPPLQVYASALIFALTDSLIRCHFRRDEPEWITTKPIMERHCNGLLQTLEHHTKSVETVAFLPDCRLLASGSWDKSILLWDPKTNVLKKILTGHTQAVSLVAFSPDYQQLALGFGDSMIWLCDVRLWDANTRVTFKLLEGHTDCIWSMAFSPNGKLLASGSEDETIRLWDAKTGGLSAIFEDHTSPVFLDYMGWPECIVAAASLPSGGRREDIENVVSSELSEVFSNELSICDVGVLYPTTLKTKSGFDSF